MNDRERGPIERVMLPEAAITSLHGILLDFDPDRLHPEFATKQTAKSPKLFWRKVVQPWLERHRVFARSRVVSSGRGLHVIVRLDPVVEFLTEADRQKWAAVVKLIQKLLPTDPDCPGITALTRPIGSVNGKNGEQVRLLRRGEPVTPEEVLALCQEALTRPFATVASLLFPAAKVSPCPVCQSDGSWMDVLDHDGMCYGGCGKIRLGQIFDLFLRPRKSKRGTR